MPPRRSRATLARTSTAGKSVLPPNRWVLDVKPPTYAASHAPNVGTALDVFAKNREEDKLDFAVLINVFSNQLNYFGTSSVATADVGVNAAIPFRRTPDRRTPDTDAGNGDGGSSTTSDSSSSDSSDSDGDEGSYFSMPSSPVTQRQQTPTPQREAANLYARLTGKMPTLPTPTVPQGLRDAWANASLLDDNHRGLLPMSLTDGIGSVVDTGSALTDAAKRALLRVPGQVVRSFKRAPKKEEPYELITSDEEEVHSNSGPLAPSSPHTSTRISQDGSDVDSIDMEMARLDRLDAKSSAAQSTDKRSNKSWTLPTGNSMFRAAQNAAGRLTTNTPRRRSTTTPTTQSTVSEPGPAMLAQATSRRREMGPVQDVLPAIPDMPQTVQSPPPAQEQFLFPSTARVRAALAQQEKERKAKAAKQKGKKPIKPAPPPVPLSEEAVLNSMVGLPGSSAMPADYASRAADALGMQRSLFESLASERAARYAQMDRNAPRRPSSARPGGGTSLRQAAARDAVQDILSRDAFNSDDVDPFWADYGKR